MIGHQTTVGIDLALKALLLFTKVIEAVQIVIIRGEDYLRKIERPSLGYLIPEV